MSFCLTLYKNNSCFFIFCVVLFNCRLEMVNLSRKIKNLTDEFTDVEVIRYFANNDTEYLIYSLNEIDESGYTKLYASKIIGNKACIISDSDEWKSITGIIKEIVRNNRDGNELMITDLNEDNLTDITLQDTRVFKLQGNLVNLLSENKKIKTNIYSDNHDDENNDMTNKVNYEELYKEQLDKNKELEIEINSLEEQIDKYKEIIEKIKEIVE